MQPRSNNTYGASRLFDCLYLVAAIVLIPYFVWRRLYKKKKSAGWRKKLGYVPERPADTPRVWIHAVSVGETTAAETLFKALKQRVPATDIVVSTTTTTGQSVAIKRYGAENVFFYPLDLSSVVKRTLDRVSPTVLVLMESEVWPNMTAEATRRNIPIVVVNGRITERAARRYRRFWFLVGPSFHRIGRWLMQSEEYAARLRALGVDDRHIRISGNMKYDAMDDLIIGQPARAAMRAALGIAANALVLACGSTHPSEESALLTAYARLRASSVPSLRLILVPRHPERTSDVAAQILAAGMRPLLRSAMSQNIADDAKSPPSQIEQPPVLLVDTLGELKHMYSVSDVAFVGGSLIPWGGQNIMEPCGLGVPTLHGPHMHNFNDAMEILRASSGSVQVTFETLFPELERLLLDRESAVAMGTRAREAFMRARGATSTVAEYICELLHA